MRSLLSLTVVAGGLLLAGTTVVRGQQGPPIEAPMGTIPLEGIVQKTSEGSHTVVVKTKDGIEHLFHLTGRTAVHGAKAAGDDALRGLEEGSTVVVHYIAEGDHLTAYEVDRIAGDGLQTVEGTVTKVDRRAKTISIRLADGSQQTLRLTERAASDVGKDIDGAAAGTAKVVVYFDDVSGRRVAHYFKRVS
jgi:phosphotransferase system IIA component